MPITLGGTPSRGGALLLLLLALASACAGGDEPARGGGAAAGEGTPEPGGTAVLAESHDIERPMPLVFQSELDGDLMDVLYMGLTRGAWRDGRLAYLTYPESPMALAWHWEYAGADSAALRYRMRSGVRWSDGVPITAHDVVWTYRMMADTATASPRLQDVAAIDSVVAEDDSTVRFHFRRRTPDMLFASGTPVAPRHVYAGVPPAQIRTHPSLGRPETLVVSGPFKIGAWAPGASVTLVPNPRSALQPRLERIVLRVIPEPTTRLVELRTGGVDVVRQIAFDAIPGLRQQAPNLRFASIQKRYWEYVAWNPRRGEPFSDPAARRALGMAVDVPGVIRALGMGDFAVPAAGPYPPIFRDFYDPERMPPLAHDPDGARRILEERGWRDADGDGVREKDGRPLRFTLLVAAGNQRRADVAQVLQRQWRAVGAAMEVRPLEFNTLQERMGTHDFEAALAGWAAGLSPDITPLFTPGSPLNIVSFQDSAVARLFAQAQAEPTAERANPVWREAAERLVASQPYTWLYYYDMVVGVNERLRGMQVDVYGLYQNSWEWWIPRDRQGGAARAPAPADSAGG